jgi:transposase
MREQLRRAPAPNPKVIGIDEISMGKRQKYRIVVSDLIRGRPIWFGGKDRSEASLDEFFVWLGPKKSRKIRLAVMDMWKAFRKSTRKKGNAPQAKILYDKYHVVTHLQKAMDQVRKSEYARLTGKGRQFIKGQRYTLLSHKRNLTVQGRKGLKLLLAANKRLNTAYVLKEQFEQLWEYKTPGGARRFFERWRDALKWQRLRPFQKFAAMIDKHWDGIVAHCAEENHVMLGFVEGFNNKIRAIQRRAFGLRDEEYLRLKVLSSMLPKIDE